MNKFIEEHKIIKRGKLTQKILYKLNCDFGRQPQNTNEKKLFKYCIYYDQSICDHKEIFKTREGKTIIVVHPYLPTTQEYIEYYDVRGFKKICSLYVSDSYSYMCVL